MPRFELQDVSVDDLIADRVTSPLAFEALRSEWRALWTRCVDATPFQSPDWLIPWWRHLGAGAGQLEVLTLRLDQRLVGLAPWVVQTDENGRTLRSLGVGVSDYLGPILDPDVRIAGAYAIAEFLNTYQLSWDRADFSDLRPDSVLLNLPMPVAGAVEIVPCASCPSVDLHPDRRARLASSWRQKLDYDWRRLRRTGEVVIERVQEENAPELFDALVELHTARWTEKDGGRGVLADEAVQRFHRDVVPAFLAVEVLRLNGLRVDGAIVASYYGFLRGDRAYYYLGGFSPEWDRFGVGNLMVDDAMSEAAREGAHTFDFLRGQEAYKYRWGARDEITFRWTWRVPRD